MRELVMHVSKRVHRISGTVMLSVESADVAASESLYKVR
jgi:hypothetical protein